MTTPSNQHPTTLPTHNHPHRETSFYCDLDPYHWICVSGNHSADFLQGQLTCDVSAVTNHQACLGAYCEPKGRVIATFFLVRHDPLYYLTLPHDMATTLVSALNKYAPFSRVKVNHITPPWHTLGIAHPNPKKIITDTQEVNTTIPITNQLTIQLISHDDYHAFINTLAQHNLQPANLKQWQYALIQAQLAFIHPATSQTLLPQMLALEKFNAVSFTKGCFVGQEIIARTQHLGTLKRHLHHLTLSSNTPLQAGEPLLLANGESAGIIVECLQTTPDQYELLAVIQDRHLESILKQP